MNNIKETLIEKERLAWIDGKIREAEFYDIILQHIIALEAGINLRDAELELLQKKVETFKEAVSGLDSEEKP
jgi:hypothetical protein